MLGHTGKSNAEKNWYSNQGKSFQHPSVEGRVLNYSQKADYHVFRIITILHKCVPFISEKYMSFCVRGIFQS